MPEVLPNARLWIIFELWWFLRLHSIVLVSCVDLGTSINYMSP